MSADYQVQQALHVAYTLAKIWRDPTDSLNLNRYRQNFNINYNMCVKLINKSYRQQRPRETSIAKS